LQRLGDGLPDVAGALTLRQYAEVLQMDRDGGFESGGRWLALWDTRSRKPSLIRRPSHVSPRFRDTDEWRRSKDGHEKAQGRGSPGSDALARVESYLAIDGYYDRRMRWCRQFGDKLAGELPGYVHEELYWYEGKAIPGRGIVRLWCKKYIIDHFYTGKRDVDGNRIRKPSNTRWSWSETERGTLLDVILHDREYGRETPRSLIPGESEYDSVKLIFKREPPKTKQLPRGERRTSANS
jgi:hypothetical protein